ncbi:MAG: hypothetical protein K8R25_00240 [Methanosarcinales archaeon]|nr:hypothetical protein [Methanosarcinales archaeon]
MLNRNLTTVITIWLISVFGAIALFLIIDATLATGEFLGFKVAGGLAGSIVIFLLLFRSYRLLGRSNLQVFLVFNGEEPVSIEQSKITYQLLNGDKNDEAKSAQLIEQFGQKYILIPNINLDDFVQIKIEADNGIWVSDKVVSSIRHLKFKRLED